MKANRKQNVTLEFSSYIQSPNEHNCTLNKKRDVKKYLHVRWSHKNMSLTKHDFVFLSITYFTYSCRRAYDYGLYYRHKICITVHKGILQISKIETELTNQL